MQSRGLVGDLVVDPGGEAKLLNPIHFPRGWPEGGLLQETGITRVCVGIAYLRPNRGYLQGSHGGYHCNETM